MFLDVFKLEKNFIKQIMAYDDNRYKIIEYVNIKQ